jgi:hypothetical protein
MEDEPFLVAVYRFAVVIFFKLADALVERWWSGGRIRRELSGSPQK